jgi:predicted RNase H-like HicB family nuclease
MIVNAVVHLAEEGGYWAEVPSIPGCATQAETLEDLERNLRDAVEGCLAARIDVPDTDGKTQVVAIAL